MSVTVKKMKNQMSDEMIPADIKNFEQLATAYQPLGYEADFKQKPEDFIVDEILPFELCGQGEHVWLQVRKQGENTEWLAKELARIAGVRKRNVGFAGLKDRHAITTQWFSVHLPGKPDPDWSVLESGEIKVLNVLRHAKKLKRGALKQNRFSIVLRSVTGETSQLIKRCEVIKQNGVPNYFGKQRFGHDMGNLQSALKMFTTDVRYPRHKKSIFISAVRSWIFNCILSQRLSDATWNQYLPGDALMLMVNRPVLEMMLLMICNNVSMMVKFTLPVCSGVLAKTW